MKRTIFLTLALCLCCLSSWAQFAHKPRLIVDDAGNEVSAAHPLPVTGTVAATGTMSIVSPDTASHTVILLSATDFVVPALSGRTQISLSATGTFEWSVGMATVPANTTPCYNAWLDLDDVATVTVKTSATATYLTVRQFGE